MSNNGLNPKRIKYKQHHILKKGSCPVCGENDPNKITQLRRAFYYCESCDTYYDVDLHTTMKRKKL